MWFPFILNIYLSLYCQCLRCCYRLQRSVTVTEQHCANADLCYVILRILVALSPWSTTGKTRQDKARQAEANNMAGTCMACFYSQFLLSTSVLSLFLSLFLTMTNRELPCTSPLRVETTRPVMRMGCRENLYRQRQKSSAVGGKLTSRVIL